MIDDNNKSLYRCVSSSSGDKSENEALKVVNLLTGLLLYD